MDNFFAASTTDIQHESSNMNIKDFISNYKNHPILFIGTGVSLRYLKKSYTWDGLLCHICSELKNNKEYYLDIKSSCAVGDKYDYSRTAGKIEQEFTDALIADRDGKFKEVNDRFYELMARGENVSRLKLYISMALSSLELKEEMGNEIAEFKKTRKNVGSIITTNYDGLIESIFEFLPLIGNNILLSNPYGSVYKIHGCVSDPQKIVITSDDYAKFNNRYELIRAQLLSLFIHNPIIFLGYSITDDNIKGILKTIFTYIEPNSEIATRIRNNFLLVEYESDSDNTEIAEHDIDIEGYSTIRINKIKTDNFSSIYKAISELTLPISAMDVRKFQSIAKEIYSGGQIQVKITEDWESLENGDRIIAIGSSKTIRYEYQTAPETIRNYFKIIDENNAHIISLIDKFIIQKNTFFPIFGFDKIQPNLAKAVMLKEQQNDKLSVTLKSINPQFQKKHTSIQSILDDDKISPSGKNSTIIWNILKGHILIGDAEIYLRSLPKDNSTNYRKLICAYDFKKYSGMKI